MAMCPVSERLGSWFHRTWIWTRAEVGAELLAPLPPRSTRSSRRDARRSGARNPGDTFGRMPAAKKESEIQVGQWLFLPFGRKPARVQVLEDRGRLGINGEKVFLIHVPMEEGVEPRQFEVSESELLRAA